MHCQRRNARLGLINSRAPHAVAAVWSALICCTHLALFPCAVQSAEQRFCIKQPENKSPFGSRSNKERIVQKPGGDKNADSKDQREKKAGKEEPGKDKKSAPEKQAPRRK